ncbi:CPBP family intramembrane glutamic endopeptidase [Halorhabdus rudnickae]|uniref:CPBP family intramembrane glutamic endopeptidase n=1 Tax=Halorhabdus rudnickae TaxID=1775544 RepID=UPI0010838401|nr:type II CAAX endopeptidase family protein [Halorhabdus rudnickae]
MRAIPWTERADISAIGEAGLWAIVGLFGSQLLAIPIVSVVFLLTGSVSPTFEYAAVMVASGIGMVILAGVYFHIYDRSRTYLDIRIPSLRDLGYSILGFILLLGGLMGISLVLQALSVQTAQHSIFETVDRTGNAELYLALIPLSFLVIAPTEEVFYRNIVQKSLYDRFERSHAVLIASSLFALIHIPAYLTSGLGPLVTTIPILFVLALVLGESYRRTRNLTVPILVHGAFNAFQFLAQYLVETRDIAAIISP